MYLIPMMGLPLNVFGSAATYILYVHMVSPLVLVPSFLKHSNVVLEVNKGNHVFSSDIYCILDVNALCNPSTSIINLSNPHV